MREKVIEFLSCNTSFTYEELQRWSNEQLDDFMWRAFGHECIM